MYHLSMEQILEQIRQAERFDELRFIRDQVHEMLQKHLLFTHYLELHEYINELHDNLIRRTIYLAERQLEEQGLGLPPASYSFILFGSGGRREQTLWSDQDNGFIYEDPQIHTTVEPEAYFAELSDTILRGLDELGYPPCQGNVVSSNPQWRKTYTQFSHMMTDWFDAPVWENVRYLLILADMRSIYGDAKLIDRLIKEFISYVAMHPSILQPLLSNTLYHKASLGVFGQLITERHGEDTGGMDIKYGAYIPIVNGIRLLSIQAGIHASSTLERLNALIRGGHIAESLGEEWKRAFIIALKLRNLTPFQLEEGLYTTRGKLKAEQLTKECRQELKFCLRAGMELQKFVRKAVESQLEKG